MTEKEDTLSYRTYYCICRNCNKMMTIDFREKLPIWKNATCPFCHKSMIPVGFSIEAYHHGEYVPTGYEVTFNPSRRNNYDKISSM